MEKRVFSFIAVWLAVLTGMLLAQDFSWEDIGRDNLNCNVLSVNSQDSKIILAAKPGSILKTENAGKNWRRVLAVKGRSSDINAMAAGADNPNVVYAATGNGLYYSSNLGEHWERIFRGKTELENQCTAVFNFKKGIFLGTKAGLFVSKDKGRSWSKEQAGIGNAYIINIDSGLGQNTPVYLAAENGIFKTLDYGQRWEKIFVSHALERSEEGVIVQDVDVSGKERNFNFVKADKTNANLVYFSSPRGVYKSINQGQSWDKLTEYGLLNRDIKMFCLSDSGGIFVLTSSGVFQYQNERWLEISVGLSAGKLKYLALDNLINIYIAAEKGIYKANSKDTIKSLSSSLLQEYLKFEPSIRNVQDAAIKYAEVSPDKISQWRKDAGKKALLPQISIGLDRNTTDLWHWEGGSTTKSDDDVLRRGRDSVDWDVSLSWDLSDLIWNKILYIPILRKMGMFLVWSQNQSILI